MSKAIRLRMLVSYAGSDFALSPGEETERFSDKEAKRLIAAEHAVKVEPPAPKRPETKDEWDEEREKLLAENALLKGEAEQAADREAAMAQRLGHLDAFQKAVTEAALLVPPQPETMVAPPAPEKRG